MAGIISEGYESRGFTIARTSSRELLFPIHGTEDEDEVKALLVGAAPAVYKGLQLESYGAEPKGNGHWDGIARYVRLNDNEFTFGAGGGTRHITQSLSTVARYAPAGETAPDFQGAINVTDEKVEGTDLPGFQFEFSETHYFNDALITSSFKFLLAQLASQSFNDADFKGFSMGECALQRVDGSKRGDEQWALTFRFAASPNVTGMTIGDITDIDKLGWDYLWIQYATFEDVGGRSLVQRPSSVHVERVLTPADYSTLGIGI